MTTSFLLSVAPAAVPELSTGWLVFAAMLAGISLAMMFFPRMPACIVAYMAMWAARFSGYTPFTGSTMLFWGVAVAIVVVNRFLLPAHIRNSRVGVGYIAGGAIVGTIVGLTLHTAAAIIVGSMVGCILGAIAFARTTRGAVLEFPSSRFFNYLGAKGIPTVIACVMVGFVLAGLILYNANTAGAQ